jgi:L-amino acid N-acyltransferase YncA
VSQVTITVRAAAAADLPRLTEIHNWYYVDPAALGRRIGSTLYGHLLGLLAQEDLHMLVAAVALPNAPSVRLHRSLGSRQVGTFEHYATKRGQYISSTWFQRPNRSSTTVHGRSAAATTTGGERSNASERRPTPPTAAGSMPAPPAPA